MSRRCHHGSPRHVPLGRVPRRPATATPERHASPAVYSAATPSTRSKAQHPEPVELDDAETPIDAGAPGQAEAPAAPAVAVAPVAPPEPEHRLAPVTYAPRPAAPRPGPRQIASPEPARPHADGEDGAIERTATAPQLRRFIKSRAYVPMHELRRRFAINGGDDDVTPVDIERKRIFVGLPEREGRLLGELLRAGDIGYELSLDPISPIVVGVYPMRPVTRV